MAVSKIALDLRAGGWASGRNPKKIQTRSAIDFCDTAPHFETKNLYGLSAGRASGASQGGRPEVEIQDVEF